MVTNKLVVEDWLIICLPVLLLPKLQTKTSKTMTTIIGMMHVYELFQRATRDKVIVMELCTGGSLFNILEDPKNSFGLPDKEFLLVLSHIGTIACLDTCWNDSLIVFFII